MKVFVVLIIIIDYFIFLPSIPFNKGTDSHVIVPSAHESSLFSPTVRCPFVQSQKKNVNKSGAIVVIPAAYLPTNEHVGRA